MQSGRRPSRVGSLCVVLCGLAAGQGIGPAAASDSLADLKPRIVGPPKPGTSGNLITVRIAPPSAPLAVVDDAASDASQGPLAPSEPLAPLDPALQTRSGGSVAAFWEMAERLAAPRRLAAAEYALTVTFPDLARRWSPARTRQTAIRYGDLISRAARSHGVPAPLILGMILVESNGNAEAVSSAGAVGLMQLMPATATRFGVTDRRDPHQSIRGGSAYMRWLLDNFDGDPLLALAGYNAGEGAVQKHAGVPPYAETRAYVPKVIAAWAAATRLCDGPGAADLLVCTDHQSAALDP